MDNRKDIASAYRAEAGLHPVSPKVKDPDYDKVHQGDGDGGNQPHLDIGFYDVLRHHPGRFFNTGLLLHFPVEGTDDPNPVQPLPYQVVLLIAKAVGNFPKRLHLAPDGDYQQGNQRQRQQDQQRKGNILGTGKDDPTEEQHRNGDDIAGQHGSDPGKGFDIMGRAGQQRRSADAADLLKGHGIYLAENRRAQIGTKAGHHPRAEIVAPQNGRQTDKRHQQHLYAAGKDILQVGQINAPIEDIAHQGGQQKRADT